MVGGGGGGGGANGGAKRKSDCSSAFALDKSASAQFNSRTVAAHRANFNPKLPNNTSSKTREPDESVPLAHTPRAQEQAREDPEVGDRLRLVGAARTSFHHIPVPSAKHDGTNGDRAQAQRE